MLDSIEATTAGAAFAGLSLGVVYFGGLWWTVRRMPRARHPLTLYFGSLVLRLAIALAVLYGVLTSLGWLQLMSALIGFVAARLLLIRMIGPAPTGEMLQREMV